MSRAAAATAGAARKTPIQNVIKQPPKAGSRAMLFNYIFEANPKPLNCAVYTPTRAIAEDPAHPFHTRTMRRLDAFDASKFYWNVKCSIDVSKKAVVRNWAVRRVRVALREVMAKQGWANDGTLLNERRERISEEGMKRPLKGALAINLNKDRSVLMATGDDVRRQCEWVLRAVVARQAEKRMSGTRET